jgi:hypothetical protein
MMECYQVILFFFKSAGIAGKNVRLFRLAERHELVLCCWLSYLEIADSETIAIFFLTKFKELK